MHLLPTRAGSRTVSGTGKAVWAGRLPYLLAFFVPFLSMILVFIGKGIFPFGDRSFLRTDLYHQYAPFFQEMKDKLSTGESLFYSWDIGLGTNFMAVFAYYLSSPMNWFLFLCPEEFVIEFITYGIVLKMSLSSLTMTWYLNRHCKTPRSIASAFFGIFYGLSGYMAAYSWNIMWLDCMLLLPVIFLGLERLVKEDKCYLYCISLGIAILSNYYIAIMICISLVIYFIVLMVLLDGEDINYPKKILNFSLFSLLAGGLSAVVLLPEIAALSYTASGRFSFPKDWTSYFSMFDMISRHLMMTEVEIGLKHWPNIYCGVGILLFIPLYFMNKRISFREKITYLTVLILFYMSFSTNILNFIWHGFHYPNSLPCRQSFIYIFFLLAMGYKGFLGLRERTSRQLTGVVVLTVLFVILTEKLEAQYTGKDDGQYYMWYSFYLSILFLLFYGGFTYLYRFSKRSWRLPLAVLTFVCITIEASINMAYTSVTTVGRTTYKEYDDTTRSLTSQAAAEDNELFYRIEKINSRTKNDGAWLDYPSASIFSSTAYAHMTALYKKLGLESSTNAYGTKYGATPASNMLLNIRYTLYTDNDAKPEDTELRTHYLTADNVDLYRNKYVLPLGFVVSPQLFTDWDMTSDDPGVNWNSLAHALGIEEDLFTPLEVTNNATTSVTVSTEGGGYFAFYSMKSGPKKLRISYNGKNKNFENLDRNYFMSLDYIPEDTIFTIANSDSSSTSIINLTAYRLNEEVLKQMYETLNRSPLEISRYTSTSVNGTINVTEAGTFVASIPYDAGWRVTVDGQEVPIYHYEDSADISDTSLLGQRITGLSDTSFLSFPISAGVHVVSMEYVPEGFFLGLAVTLISIILLVMIWLLIRQWKKNHALEAAEEYDDEEEDFPAPDPVPVDTPQTEAASMLDTDYSGPMDTDASSTADAAFSDSVDSNVSSPADEDLSDVSGAISSAASKKSSSSSRGKRTSQDFDSLQQDLVRQRTNALRKKGKGSQK